MRDFFKSMRFKILMAILLVMAGFMIAAVYSGGRESAASQGISSVLGPVQRLSASITSNVSEFFKKYFDSAHNYEENKMLREQVIEYQKMLVDYEQIKHEYEQFQKISDMREQHDDWGLSTASIIDRDYSNPFNTFTVDRGSLDDVSYLDPVIAADGQGLVGYVVQVGLTTSKVMTLLDVNIDIGASNSRTRDVGVITGTVELAPQGLCRMGYLPRESPTEPGEDLTRPGDIIVTSGGSLFPKGIVVGTVESVEPSTLGNSMEAIVRPAVNVRNIKDVFIITSFEGQGAD